MKILFISAINPIIPNKGANDPHIQRSLSFLRRQESRQCLLDSHFRENEGQGK